LISSHTLAWTSLAIGGWAVGNGILHDIAVIRGHFREYDRQFLYYILNGHIIIFSGIFEMVSYAGVDRDQMWGSIVSGIAAVGMVIYCVMIWKFLPSILTIALQSGLFILLVLHLLKTL